MEEPSQEVLNLCNEASSLPRLLRSIVVEVGRLDFRIEAVMQNIVVTTEGCIATKSTADAATCTLLRSLEEEAMTLCARKTQLCAEAQRLVQSMRQKVSDTLEELPA